MDDKTRKNEKRKKNGKTKKNEKVEKVEKAEKTVERNRPLKLVIGVLAVIIFSIIILAALADAKRKRKW